MTSFLTVETSHATAAAAAVLELRDENIRTQQGTRERDRRAEALLPSSLHLSVADFV